MLDLTDFVPRLKQVIRWTERRMQQFTYPADRQNHGVIFRHFNPLLNGQPLYSDDRGSHTWNPDVYELENFRQALQAIFRQRDAQAIASSGNLGNFQALGRILYFEAQLTTHDGMAIAESNDFLDESDVPPLDTWFHLDDAPGLPRPRLFCWIPRKFEAIMQRVASMDVMRSYHWLDQENPAAHQRVVAAMTA